MRASVGGGSSGAAARAAGPESLSPRERPENACVERVLRMFDGNGFSESDKVGRPSDPKPETIQYKEREREVCEREQEKQRDERERGCDDDNVSVSTDASCLTDLSLETVAEEPFLSLFLSLDAYADRAATLSIQLKHTHTHREAQKLRQELADVDRAARTVACRLHAARARSKEQARREAVGQQAHQASARWVKTAAGEWVRAEPGRVTSRSSIDSHDLSAQRQEEEQQAYKEAEEKRRQRNRNKKNKKKDKKRQQRAVAAAAVTAGKVAMQAQQAAEQVLGWAGRFPIKIAGWAARRAAQGAAAAAKKEAEYAAEEARWAAEDREWEQELTLRITVMLRTGLTRRRAGRRGVGSGRRRNRRAGKERKRQQQERMRQKRALKGWRQAELQFVQRQELKWFGKSDTDSKERLVRWKQRQVRMRARGSGIWQQQRRGRAGEHEGSAPASLRRRRVRAAGAGWGHSPRYWRLGGGGKQGWVT